MFEKGTIAVQDEKAFRGVESAIVSAFSPASVQDFLKSVQRASLRIRDFEAVLKAGLLGSGAAAAYAGLGNSDQGQIREMYLASLEKVPSELRERFFKLYAYY